jgi:hypothetical protein
LVVDTRGERTLKTREEIVDHLVAKANPPNAHAEVVLREVLSAQAWLIDKCLEQGLSVDQIKKILEIENG